MSEWTSLPGSDVKSALSGPTDWILHRPWHWLCACWPACLFEAVGPVRATTIYFPLARWASFCFVLFLVFFSASYAAIIFTGNRQNSEGNVNLYLFFVIGLMYKSVQRHAWNHKTFGSLHVFGGPVGFFGGPVDFLIHWPPGPVVATVQCQGLLRHIREYFFMKSLAQQGSGT